MDKFYSLQFLVILSIVWSSVVVEGCTKYCICSLEVTSCYFDYDNSGVCVGEIPMIETYVLNIHGPVCIGVRDMLKKPLFANTVKVFHNDLCLETPNCRYVITTFDCISCECLSVCGSTAYTTDHTLTCVCDSIPLPLCVCVCQLHTLLMTPLMTPYPYLCVCVCVCVCVNCIHY